MSILSDFYDYISKTDEKVAAKKLGIYPANIKRYKAKTHRPDATVLDRFSQFPKNGSPQKGTVAPKPTLVESVPEERQEEESQEESVVQVETATEEEIEIEGEKVKVLDLAHPPEGYYYVNGIDDRGVPCPQLMPIPNYVPQAAAAPAQQVVKPAASESRIAPFDDPRQKKPKAVRQPPQMPARFQQPAAPVAPPVAPVPLPMVASPVVTNGNGDGYHFGNIEEIRNFFFPYTSKFITILIPTMKAICPATNECIAALISDLGKERVNYKHIWGDSMIYNSRNKLAHEFMVNTKSEWALWLDDDMILPTGRPQLFKRAGLLPLEYPDAAAGLHTVERLMSHQKTFVGATYFGRFRYGPPMFGEMKSTQLNSEARRFANKIHPTAWIGTGCLLTHRSVFTSIQQTFPELGPKEGQKYWDYFAPQVPGTKGGEDVAFSTRAKAAGHQPFIDFGLHCLHVGQCCYHALNTTNTEKNPYQED